MPNFKLQANITGSRTGRERQVTATIPAESESAARAELADNMRFIGQNIDGDVTVQRDND
jgi:hypothetical protein